MALMYAHSPLAFIVEINSESRMEMRGRHSNLQSVRATQLSQPQQLPNNPSLHLPNQYQPFQHQPMKKNVIPE